MFYEKIELNLEAVHSTGQNCKFYRSIFGFCEVVAMVFMVVMVATMRSTLRLTMSSLSSSSITWTRPPTLWTTLPIALPHPTKYQVTWWTTVFCCCRIIMHWLRQGRVRRTKAAAAGGGVFSYLRYYYFLVSSSRFSPMGRGCLPDWATFYPSKKVYLSKN